MVAAIAAIAAETVSVVITPTQDYRRTDHPVPGKPLSGLDAWTNSLLGFYRRRAGLEPDVGEFKFDGLGQKQRGQQDQEGEQRDFPHDESSLEGFCCVKIFDFG